MTEYSLQIRSVTIHLYDVLDHPQSVTKIERLRAYFEYMPDTHLRVVYPILIVERTQGGGSGGGILSARGVSDFTPKLTKPHLTSRAAYRQNAERQSKTPTVGTRCLSPRR